MSKSPAPAIEISKLYKVYPAKSPKGEDVQAVSNLNLTINQGEFFALLGPNGAGKTSLISIMAGPNKLTSGSIKICGLDITTHREETKFLLGIVPQEISFDSFFTVNEVLKLQSGYYGIRDNQSYIDEILENLGLTDKKYANTRALSGGMKRRLLIAKALVHKPKVIVLDEPTAGVDVELRHSLWKYMRKLNKQGLTILLTTHYLEEAESLCKRTAIINHGKLVALDKTKDLIKSMGSCKVMTLSFDHKLGRLPAALKNFKTKQINSHDLQIHFDTKELSKLLDAIKNLNPTDIDIDGQDLEDVFIQLTYRQDEK
jgi:ABC-2 type transport system ATP-binding protein